MRQGKMGSQEGKANRKSWERELRKVMRIERKIKSGRKVKAKTN